MKALIKYGLMGAAVVVIAVLFMRSCSLYNANGVLKGQYDTLKKIADADHAILTKEIGQLTNDIGQRDKEIKKLTESITLIYTDLADKDSSIAELIRKLHILEVGGDFPGQIANLKEQVRIWSEKFSLAESIIVEKDKIIAAWAIKYADAVKIGEGWKQDRDNEYTLRLLAEKRIGGLESSLRMTRFWRTGATALAVVAGGYVGYTLIKGT